MRWWIGGGVLAAGAIVAAATFLLMPGDPPVPQWRQDFWAARRLASKDRAAAIVALEALVEKTRAESNRAAELKSLEELAAYYRLEGRTEDAIAAYKTLLALPAFKPNPGNLKDGRLRFKGWIASLSCRKAPYDEGIAMYRQMIEAGRSGIVHPQYPMSSLYADLARCLTAAGRTEEGLSALRENLARVKAADWASPPEVFEAHAQLARTLARAGRPQEARAAFLELLPLFMERDRVDRRDPAQIELQRRLQAATSRADKDRLLDDFKKERQRRSERLERSLLALVEDLARRGVFAQRPAPN